MEPQFNPFKAFAPLDFRELMIAYWMEYEEASREKVLKWYGAKDFDKFCESLTGQIKEFRPPAYKSNGNFCFMVEDDTFVIPVNILISVFEVKNA